MDEFVCDQCSKIVSEPVEDEPYQICAECRAENNALRAQLDIAVKALEHLSICGGPNCDHNPYQYASDAFASIAKMGGGKS